ncbi:FAD-dependent oxidoreductase [Xenophilus azovorans]|uniref:FAD-dependent oxidoreductase n=1 Tax=Xenophilus azovorans TaxID=151755 RepID=UPI00056F1CA9|nr:FAD-binding protein [Xenophilus azovorans]
MRTRASLFSRPRRLLLSAAAAMPWLGRLPAARAAAPTVRPGEPGWPDEADWQRLGVATGGALMRVESPWPAARQDPAEAERLLRALKNPYFTRDSVALTQTLGYVDAWTSQPSAWAVAARNAQEVAAAVDFARTRRVRLAVKGGGHAYQGTSNAAGSLLVWTRRMNDAAVHEDFVPEGCAGRLPPQRAVTLGAGAVWGEAYDAVTTRAGGYVQGGGCMTVGVAGLVQSGGFGSFSKAFGLASASLLQAEVVTADGAVRTVNACRDPELFWALKGGGGGSFGVVTRLTLKVHPLPRTFGAIEMTVQAASPEAFRRLIAQTLGFARTALLSPHWGEQIRLLPGERLQVSMVFQGLNRAEAGAVWQPFIDAVQAAPEEVRFLSSPLVVGTSARDFWAPSWIKRSLGFQARDERPGAPATNVFWPGDQGQAGQVLHGYASTWLPAALLHGEAPGALADALFAASRESGLSLHFNKGLAGAPPEVLAAARDTAMNPAVLDAFALLIMGAGEQPAYPGLPGHEPQVERGRARAAAIRRGMAALRQVVPDGGAYLSESDYFQPDWPRAFWGGHHARLLAAKRRYDPDGLFTVHHGVGSEPGVG